MALCRRNPVLQAPEADRALAESGTNSATSSRRKARATLATTWIGSERARWRSLQVKGWSVMRHARTANPPSYGRCDLA